MMNITRTSNPVFKEQVFRKGYVSTSNVMTVNGTVNKTALMLLLVIAGALYTWNKFFNAIDLVEKVKKSGYHIGIFLVNESTWVDVGQWEEYHQVTKRLSNR